MFTAFSTALSALNADTTAISVVGNNLANLNTAGFKASEVILQRPGDAVDWRGPGRDAGGVGVGTPVTMLQFTQGALQSTGGPLDAAIQGNGFFVVQTTSGLTEYTRGGTFQTNLQGALTTSTGELVQGWSATNGTFNTNNPIGNITVPSGSLQPPVATQNASLSANLDASAAAGTNYSTSMSVYDSLGNSHVVTFDFTQSSTPNQWNYTMSFPNGDSTAPGTPTTGTLTFRTPAET